MVAHPGIGRGLETLLGLADRYEVQRALAVTDAATLSAEWKPDAVLLDGTLIDDGAQPSFGAPTVVLSGSAATGRGLAARIGGAGWLRKDPTLDELVYGIENVLVGRAPDERRGLPRWARWAGAIIAVGVIAYIVWLAIS